MVNFDSYFDPPESDEDPTIDFVYQAVRAGADKDTARAQFDAEFAADFQPEYIAEAFEFAFAEAIRQINAETLPDFDPEIDYSKPDPPDFFMIEPELRDPNE